MIIPGPVSRLPRDEQEPDGERRGLPEAELRGMRARRKSGMQVTAET